MSAAFQVFLLRHGESTANVEGVIASGLAVAQYAYGLTETGRAQVAASVTAARDGGVLPAGLRVVSSPLRRARESAEIAAGVLGVSYEVDNRLAERGFGTLDLGPDSSYAGVWARDAADPSHEAWGVESVTAVLLRGTALLEELERAAASAAGAAAGAPGVLLCTHGDVASSLLCAAAGEPLERHREVGALGNAEIRALSGRGTRARGRPAPAARPPGR